MSKAQRFTPDQKLRALQLRDQGWCWKKVCALLGDGIDDAINADRYRARHGGKIAALRSARRAEGKPMPESWRPHTAKCTVRTNGHKFEGRVKMSDRRARVMCNAHFGLDLFAGMKLTETERRITERTIRFLRRHGLLYESTVTDVGRLFLSNIKRVGVTSEEVKC